MIQMPVWLLAEGRAVDVWGVRHLLPANRQADRVALYTKALCFLLFFFLLCVEVILLFLPLYAVFLGKWQQGFRSHFGFEKGRW